MMTNFNSKLKKEQDQLNDKLEELENFIMDDEFVKIDEFQQTMITIQLSAMTTYLQCLNARINKL